MGRAIVREPDVFLFDEPLSNLDAKLRAQMRLEIKKLHSTLKVTSVFVTHDQVEAMTMADRLIVMNAGIAEQIGSPLEVYGRPATKHVAGFIGSPSMNFFEGVLRNGHVELSTGLRIPTAANGLDVADGTSVWFGIRPEHMVLAEDTQDEGAMAIQIEMIEHLGSDTLVHGFHQDKQVTLLTSATQDLHEAGKIRVLLPAEHHHFFDKSTEIRLRDRD